MTKVLLVLIASIPIACGASAQTKRFYDTSGKRVGNSSTDSQGTTTIYDSSGRVVARKSKSGNTTTVYDASGRSIGKVTNGASR